MDDPQPGSPAWWLDELIEHQSCRAQKLATLDRYYEGNHPLEFASQKFREVFGGLFSEFADNWCETIVSATQERLNVTGFRFGEADEADSEAWRIWQANGLDVESSIAHTEALALSECYALVWPNPDDPETPRVTIEHPTQMVAIPAANDRRTMAAAGKFYIDRSDYMVAYVYLPLTVHRFRSEQPVDEGMAPDWRGTKWVPEDRTDVEDPAEQPNPSAPRVPVVPIQNRPRLVKPPRSEIENIIPLQDACNKLWCDMMVSSEFAAFVQRYVLGYEPDVDPETNQPKPPPWKFQDRTWIIPGNDAGEQPVSVGTFQAGDLSNYLKAIEVVVNHIASMTRTPPHYLSPSADRLSGESIKASESGLISKVRQRMVSFGESWEQILRLCFALKGDERATFIQAETIWADPEQRSEAEVADAALKRQALGIPLRPVLEYLGYTPTQIERILADQQAEAFLAPAPVMPALPPVAAGA